MYVTTVDTAASTSDMNNIAFRLCAMGYQSIHVTSQRTGNNETKAYPTIRICLLITLTGDCLSRNAQTSYAKCPLWVINPKPSKGKGDDAEYPIRQRSSHKQMAAALQFMQEQNITEYDQLSAKAEDAVSRFHALTEQLRRTEADLSATSELMGAVVQYAKTRPVFDGYKAAKYSRKFLAEHEAELADYRAAKATMGELLGGEKLPKMAELKEKRRQLAARKKALYTEYRSAQEEMRQAVAVKANIDHLLGVTDSQRKKERER